MNSKFLLVVFMAVLFSLAAGQTTNKTEDADLKEWWKDKVIYEVNIRQFSEAGTFKAFEKHLPRLKELGVEILWLMPIHPIGEKNRKGTLGSYYSVKDYLKVNPNFGTLDDFRSLVNKIHQMDMYVIIDWVANHCAWDNHLVNDHPDWFTKDENGNMIAPVKDWKDVVDFDYSNQELRKYMADALKFWIKEIDIDGYRCDVAEMVPFDFWKPAIEEIRQIKPIFMLAEAGSPECHLNGFDATYGWDVYHMMNDIAKGKKGLKALKKLLTKENQLVSNGVYRMNFITNHDENSWNGTVFERLHDGVESFATLSFMIPGMPLIYSGQEVGLDKRLSFFEKDVISWEINQYTELYSNLIKLYKCSHAMHSEDGKDNFQFVKTSNDSKILAFIRYSKTNKMLSIFNFSPEEVTFNLKDFKVKDGLKLRIPDKQKELNVTEKIIMNPWSYLIYSN